MSLGQTTFFGTDDLGALRLKAEPLFTSAECASFDLGADWFDLLGRFGRSDGVRVRYCVTEVDQQPVAVLPLVCGGAGLRSWTTFYSSLYRPLLAAGASSDVLGHAIRQALADCGAVSVRLDALDPEHASFPLILAGMRAAGLRPFVFHDFANWYLPVDFDYAAYLARLPSRVRNTLSRRERRFAKSSGAAIEILDGSTGLERITAAWTQIYAASWKKPEPFPEFMPGLISLAARRGWLRFGLAEIDGVPIAAQIWIVNGGRAAIYKLAYDEAYKSLSAGTILTAHLMRQVIDVDKVDEVDYLVGDDAYKKDWMTHRRERVGIIAYNPRTIRGLAGIAHQTLSQWRKRFHSKP